MIDFFIDFLTFANLTVLVLVYVGYRKDMKRIEENAKISEDFAEFLRTGNDQPWRGKK